MSDRRQNIEIATFIIRSGGGTIISPTMFNPIRFTSPSSNPTLATTLSNRMSVSVISETENNVLSVLV
jgi:hypothetical protein